MAMNYTSLIADKSTSGSIKSWVNYSKLDAESVLEDAEALLYQRLRVREMRASENIPVAIGDDSEALPAGFLDPIITRDITNGFNLLHRSEEELENMRSWLSGSLVSGDPSYFAIFDEAFNFDVKTTTAFTIRCVFYKTPTNLGASNTTNFMTSRYPHVLRAACLASAARYMNEDTAYAREERKLFALIDEINIADEFSRHGQTTPVMG